MRHRAIPIAVRVVPYYPEKPAQTTEIEMYQALAQIKERSNLQAGLRELSALIEKYRSAQAGFYSGLGEGYRAAGDLAKAISFSRRRRVVRRLPKSYGCSSPTR